MLKFFPGSESWWAWYLNLYWICRFIFVLSSCIGFIVASLSLVLFWLRDFSAVVVWFLPCWTISWTYAMQQTSHTDLYLGTAKWCNRELQKGVRQLLELWFWKLLKWWGREDWYCNASAFLLPFCICFLCPLLWWKWTLFHLRFFLIPLFSL